MQRYKHKETGVEVEAVQLTKENASEVADWVVGKEVEEIDALDASRHYVGLNFISWDGMARASEGDYIIKDPVGSFLSRWPEAFEANFEKVEE